MSLHHILSPFNIEGGVTWHALDFAHELRQQGNEVRLWTPTACNQDLSEIDGVTLIRPFQALLPDKGHLWVMSPDCPIGSWYQQAKFEEITVVYNQHASHILHSTLHVLSKAGSINVNVEYVSSKLANLIGIPGKIKAPSFDIQRFTSVALKDKKPINRQFTIGKTSRDVMTKHHFKDVALYKTLSDEDCKIRILGGTCMKPWFEGTKNIELLPTTLQSELVTFLNSLDCFFFRTSPSSLEGFGLSIVEAMLFAIPVVAHISGGYADIIEHEINGFLFDSNEQALNYLLELKTNPNLRQKIGVKGRSTITDLYS